MRFETVKAVVDGAVFEVKVKGRLPNFDVAAGSTAISTSCTPLNSSPFGTRHSLGCLFS